MSRSSEHRILDVTDGSTFVLVPPCADPRFDHRSCDYWEDGLRGSKAARRSWWQPASKPAARPSRPDVSDNPFAPALDAAPAFNPFATPRSTPAADLSTLLATDGPDDHFVGSDVNPFAPRPTSAAGSSADAPRKLQLLTRGLAVFGSYAKVLLVDDEPAAYAQFGPLSAYPRAQHIRDLYPRLPSAPLPAVIACIATTPSARGQGLGRELVSAVTADLGSRGFAAVEAYPDLTLAVDEASAAHPRFWIECGFASAADDERYPVMRLELA
jgi:ribosomal protein S18 acetylase RimI-like enzyme